MDIPVVAKFFAAPALVALLAISVSLTYHPPEPGGAGPPTSVATASEHSTSDAPTPTVPTPTTRTPPTMEKRTVIETQDIPFGRRIVNDSSSAEGTTSVTTYGVPGKRTLNFEVTVVDGQELSRRLLSDVVSRQPVTEVISVGTRTASNCDPNYSGPCVPIASDVDCAGGQGNGPAYVRGPVRVVGTDIYGLDRDKNGVGCEEG